jgi:putative endonuclease
MRTYYVYVMASRSRTLYTGVTRDLTRRVSEHKQKLVPGFSSTYNISRLVYYEDFRNIWAAIAREKEIKAWRRSKKIALIESRNPVWLDLSEEWFGKADPCRRGDRSG